MVTADAPGPVPRAHPAPAPDPGVTAVVVPAYQEEQALPTTLAELARALPDVDVVVVDDGSTDATAARAHAAGVQVIRLPFNLGVGGAVRTGLRYVAERGYARAVIVDADGQHDARDVRSLLAAIDAGADVAIGSRFAPGAAPYDLGRSRRWAIGVLRRLVARLTGQRIDDVTSGFRAFDRPVVELLAREYPAEYLADTVEVLLIVHQAGFTIVEVPVRMRPRAGGEPSSGSVKLVLNFARLVVGILSSAYRRRPRKEHG